MIMLDSKNKRLIFNVPYNYRDLFFSKGIVLLWDSKNKYLYLPLNTVFLLKEALLKETKNLNIKIENRVIKLLNNIDYTKINKSFDNIKEVDIKSLIPKGLELKPFQIEGVKYLIQNKHSLLCDEMGLGKCITNNHVITTSNGIYTPLELWVNNKNNIIYDGMGEWKKEDNLEVYSLNKDNQVITTRVKNLYRQKVNENLNRVILKNNNVLELTKRHKLYILGKGWTFDYKEGDSLYVFDKKNIDSFKITTIDRIEDFYYNGYVFDFEVEEHHNYIANNIFCHNTVQTLVYLNYKPEDKFPVLVICPSSIIYNWRDHSLKWIKNISPEDINIITPNNRNLYSDKKIYITSYDMLSKYIQKIVEKDKERYDMGEIKKRPKAPSTYIDSIQFKTIIIDEAHYLQTLKTKRTKAVHTSNIKNANHKILITGTPMMNKPINLYSLLNFIYPKLFNRKDIFGIRYCDPEFTKWGIQYKGVSNSTELNNKLKVFMIRRLVKDVLKELPSLQRTLITLEPLNVNKYNDLVQETSSNIQSLYTKNGNKIDIKIRNEVFQKIEYMRQKMYEYKKDYCYDFLNQKLDEVNKIIVFTYHKQPAYELHDYLNKKNIKNLTLTGDDSPEEKRRKQQLFQNDESMRVLIGTIRAANMGIDLYSSSTVIFFELDWIPANLDQAEKRAHRIGQTLPVNAYYLLLNNSIETKIMDIIHKKHKLIDMVIEGKTEEQAIQNIFEMYDELFLDFIHKKEF